MAMIKVFKAADTNYATNGEIIVKPINAAITKTNEEEYLELEAPLKYAEFLIQDNVLLVDTLTGKKGYRIHNPITGTTIEVKAWLCYQESTSVGTDRGVVISHGKNLEHCEIDSNWDDVVTKLIPVGYNGSTLPEGYLSVVSPYQKEYVKTIEFDLTESLEDEAELLDEAISLNDSLVTSLKNSVTILTARIPAYDSSVASLEAEISSLQTRYNQLGNTEPELKEKAKIEAQIPLIEDEITALGEEKATTQGLLTQTQSDLTAAQSDLAIAKATYNNLVIGDLRSQAQQYLNINQYPQINYDLEAHLDGVVEIGDTVHVKHPDMRVDLLTQVTAYQLDCLTLKFKKVEFGTLKPTLKGRLTEIEQKVEKVNETTKKIGNSITKYSSEYKRDNEEMVSKFTSELYGMTNGVFGMIQKNMSVLRQTASEISATVSRVNADLSQNIASLDITADQIQLTVAAIDRDLSSAESTITQQANMISLRVEKGKVISEINQTAESIKISASKIDLTGLVTISDLETAGKTIVNGSNVTTGIVKSKNYASGSAGMKIDLDTGIIDSKGFKILANGNALFATGAVSIDDSDIVVTAPSGSLKAKYGSSTFDLIGFDGANRIYIGAKNTISLSYLYMYQRYITIGYPGTSYGARVSIDSSYIGLYGATPVLRQSVDRVYPASVNLQNLATRFNALVTALTTLGAIDGSDQT
jgi:hypothetical protein